MTKPKSLSSHADSTSSPSVRQRLAMRCNLILIRAGLAVVVFLVGSPLLAAQTREARQKAGSREPQQTGPQSISDYVTGGDEIRCAEATRTLSTELANGIITVVRRCDYSPAFVPAIGCLPEPCDWTVRRVWKEIYGIQDGQIALIERIEGTIKPAQPESIEWPSFSFRGLPATGPASIHLQGARVRRKR